MKLISRIPAWLKNKYFLALTLFLAFLLFFDDRDLFTNLRHHRQLLELRKSKAYYEKEINKTREELNQLKSDAATLERFAREKYLMKRDKEDIFLVPANKE